MLTSTGHTHSINVILVVVLSLIVITHYMAIQCGSEPIHYIDVIMTAMASQITSLTALLNRLFGRRSKKTSKLRVTGLCAGNSPGPVNSPHKGPVTRKMFPFDDVIMHSMRLFTQYISEGIHIPRKHSIEDSNTLECKDGHSGIIVYLGGTRVCHVSDRHAATDDKLVTVTNIQIQYAEWPKTSVTYMLKT